MKVPLPPAVIVPGETYAALWRLVGNAETFLSIYAARIRKRLPDADANVQALKAAIARVHEAVAAEARGR